VGGCSLLEQIVHAKGEGDLNAASPVFVL